MQRFLHSLKFRILIVAVGMFCISMAVETYIWTKSTLRQAGNTASQNLYSSVKVSNQNLENTMKDIDRVTALASSDFGSSRCVRNYLKAMEPDSPASDQQKIQCAREVYQYLFQLCSYKYYLNGMAIYNMKGAYQAFGTIMNGQDLADQPWYQEFLENEEIFRIIPAHKSLPGDERRETQVISIIRKIKYGNAVQGVVLADIKYEILSDFYGFEEITDYQIVITDDGDDHIIYPSPPGIGVDGLEIIKESEDDPEVYSVQKVNGKRYLILKMQMPFTQWNIFGILEYRTLIHDFLRTLYKVLALNIVIAVIVCAAITSATFYMTRELSKLAKAVQNLNMDHLKLDVSIDRDDEVGTLYRRICDMLHRICDLIHQIQLTENEKRELEIAALQEQINPHFLYNTLNTISMLASFRGMKNIQDVSVALSDMMRLTLDPKKYITVEKEVSYVKRYLEIMEYKYSGKFLTVCEVDDAISSQLIPKMILQPIVENSLHHGLAAISRPGVISILIERYDRYLKILIRDNGKGMEKEVLETLNEGYISGRPGEKHIGVRNVRDRLYLIYGEECRFHITSKQNEFTEVEIDLPLPEQGDILK